MAVKIFVSADMEGVCGVVHPAQTRPGHPEYGRFRRLFTQEVNAAVAGAYDGGATEVVVNDAHFTMTNLLLEELHPGARLISGATKPLCQMEGLDASCAGVFLVGYHGGDGEGDSVINHTLVGATIRRLQVNGRTVDEAALNAGVAAELGVPIALLTGDDRVCDTAAEALPGVEVAPVKRAIDRLSAEHLGLAAARALIRERATAAAASLGRGAITPLAPESPVRLTIEFKSTSCAHMCTLFPAVERIGPREIAIEHASFTAAYRHFWGLAITALAVQDGVFGL